MAEVPVLLKPGVTAGWRTEDFLLTLLAWLNGRLKARICRARTNSSEGSLLVWASPANTGMLRYGLRILTCLWMILPLRPHLLAESASQVWSSLIIQMHRWAIQSRMTLKKRSRRKTRGWATNSLFPSPRSLPSLADFLPLPHPSHAPQLSEMPFWFLQNTTAPDLVDFRVLF